MKNLPKRLWNRLRLSHHMAGSLYQSAGLLTGPRMSGIYDSDHAGITFCTAYQYGIGPLGYGSFHVGPACFFGQVDGAFDRLDVYGVSADMNILCTQACKYLGDPGAGPDFIPASFGISVEFTPVFVICSL